MAAFMSSVAGKGAQTSTPRPDATLGVNLEDAANGVQAFAHADQPQTGAPCSIDIEADAVIDNR